MILPTINFNGVNKVMFANSEISKVYCGSHLVWERKDMSNCIVIYADAQTGSLEDKIYFKGSIDPRISESNIDRIVIMGKYTIDGSYVKEIVSNPFLSRIKFKDTLNALSGMNEFIEVGSKLEFYLK